MLHYNLEPITVAVISALPKGTGPSGPTCANVNNCNGPGICTATDVCTCNGNWNQAPNCATCKDHRNQATGCTTCITGWTGANCDNVVPPVIDPVCTKVNCGTLCWNGVCYRPDHYVCINMRLCPTGTLLCGIACHSPICVNGYHQSCDCIV